jgi:hypothetical protein
VADEIADYRLLDLDDVGALVSEVHGGEWSRDHTRELDDSDSVKRA